MFAFLFFLVLLVLVLLGALWVVMHLLGFRMMRQPARSPVGPAVPDTRSYPSPVASSFLTEATRRDVMLSALSQPPFADQLMPEQRDALRRALLGPDVVEKYTFPDEAPVLPAGTVPENTPVVSSNPSSPAPAHALPLTPPRAPRRAMVETVRASWDPAVLLLYMGALLVVIAGLIFASYSWGTWGGWQKLGMLIGATAAFLVVGFGLQQFERIRPAARTFVTIGGLLVPANALAAYTIFHDADPLLILLAGSAITALIHGILSSEPQAHVFRFTSVAALMMAIVSLPGAMGLRAGWGCVLALILIGIPPDPWGRLERFTRAWMFIGAASILPLAGIGLLSNQGEKHWMMPLLLIALGLALNRVGSRAPNVQGGLQVIADIVLVSANASAAWILTGDRWVLAAVLLSVGLLLVRYSRTFPLIAPELETMAAFPLAGFLGEVTRELSTSDGGISVLFATLTLAMLLLARRWPKIAPLTHGIAVITLPTALLPLFDPFWDRAVFFTVLTATLMLWRWRHRVVGDVPYALASVTACVAVFAWIAAAEIDSDQAWVTILTLTAVTAAGIANLTPFAALAGWVRNLIRFETVLLFLLAYLINASDDPHMAVATIAMAAMGWNVWANRHVFWSLPGAIFLILLFEDFVVPPRTSDYELWQFNTLLIVLLGALAWQLDRRTRAGGRTWLTAGMYVWAVMVGTAAGTASWVDVDLQAHPIGISLSLLIIAAIHVIAWRSASQSLFVVPALVYAAYANGLLLAYVEPASHHLVIGLVFIALAAAMYWREHLVRFGIGFVLVSLAVAHLNAAADQPAVPGVAIGLVTAWLLFSMAVIGWRLQPTSWPVGTIWLQAMLLHVVALFGPRFGDATVIFSRSALVLALVSLAGTIAVYGLLVRNRWHLFVASGVAMAALMLQINAGQPGNVHVYTVPLALYLLGLGLLLRRHPQTANVLLAAGSGVLVVPAMLEALTTGSLTWLWIALAESLALFLMGTMLQLRIPTAAAVIAVSVIALRMLVMAINAYASWISMLAIGVALLVLGTLWLMYRESIQERLHGWFSRWLAFD